MATEGKLEKVKLYAYNNPDYGEDHLVEAQPFEAMVNPESYVLDYKVEFNESQAPGTSGTQQRFTAKRPEELGFEFLFDATGIIDGKPRADVYDEIERFKMLLLGYDSASHEPKHFKLIWGKLIFKGRCNALTVTYKLFNPDGRPIRATAKATFKGSVDEPLRVAQEAPASPDLTHHRVVTAGDTLPLMCYRIYGDARYYIQVARANGLKNFRNLQAGQEIFFPPIAKT